MWPDRPCILTHRWGGKRLLSSTQGAGPPPHLREGPPPHHGWRAPLSPWGEAPSPHFWERVVPHLAQPHLGQRAFPLASGRGASPSKDGLPHFQERALPLTSGRGPHHSPRGEGPLPHLGERALFLISERGPSPSPPGEGSLPPSLRGEGGLPHLRLPHLEERALSLTSGDGRPVYHGTCSSSSARGAPLRFSTVFTQSRNRPLRARAPPSLSLTLSHLFLTCIPPTPLCSLAPPGLPLPHLHPPAPLCSLAPRGPPLPHLHPPHPSAPLIPLPTPRTARLPLSFDSLPSIFSSLFPVCLAPFPSVLSWGATAVLYTFASTSFRRR